MYAPDPQEKLDFECLDVRLYLSLKKLHADLKSGWDSGDWGTPDEDTLVMLQEATHVLHCFEQTHGPLPEWAVARNFGYELIPGAQLCTLDGRRHGNGWIVDTEKLKLHAPENPNHFQDYKTFYRCITDAGSTMTFTEQELRTAFTIGDWICTKERILRDFDRHGHFTEEPL